jgi:hypothetical protein
MGNPFPTSQAEMPIINRISPTIDTLKQELREADGILSVKVEHLLVIVGGERAGSNIRKWLIQHLRDNRIDILGEIPASKHEYVRLFDLDLPSGDLYADLQKPGIEQDERLRELIDRDCRQKLRQIRAIVS